MDTPIKKILVPVDYSECSRAALAFAVEMARSDGAELDIVHVWDRPTYVSDAVVVQKDGGAKRSLVEMIRENAEHDMDAFVSESKLPTELRFRKRLISGNPAAKILEELERGEHALLVVGTHGRTGLSHLLLGSVAERLVRLSPVPVLTVPDARRLLR
jgi:nucleotide-binding universal stress UspA family protein